MQASTPLDPEDILTDALQLFGSKPPADGPITYGPLRFTVPAKEGKANTLLADHLFSPALFLAEKIESGQITAGGLRGCGCGLPSLLLATSPDPPSLVVLTDYPDPAMLANLENNIERNRHLFLNFPNRQVDVRWSGYAWGGDISPLTKILADSHLDADGYDVIILSDLLHFDSCHDLLILSTVSLLSERRNATVYVSAGKYTKPDVCDQFLSDAKTAGLVFQEIAPDEAENDQWLGKLEVSNLNSEQLIERKQNCRFWVGKRG